MAQMRLPIFSDGVTEITSDLGYQKDDDTVVYFYGTLPVFSHQVDDLRSFRMICSQFYVNGSVRQVDLVRTFGLNPLAVKRWVKTYREQGAAGFFQSPKGKRKPRVLTPETLSKVQRRLDDGQAIAQVAKQLDLKADTLHKAVRAGRLVKPVKKNRAKKMVKS
jgi:transposase-like protein